MPVAAARRLFVIALVVAGCGMVAAAVEPTTPARLSLGTVGDGSERQQTFTPFVPSTTGVTAPDDTVVDDTTTTTAPRRATRTTASPPITLPPITIPPIVTTTTVPQEEGFHTGRVLDPAGRPLADVCFQSGLPDPVTFGPWILSRTGTDGRYRLYEGFMFASMRFCDGRPGSPFGYAFPAMIESALNEGTLGPDIVLEEQGALRGILLDQQGRPVSGVVVALSGDATGIPFEDRQPTGADGRFSFPRVSTGTQDIWLHQRPWIDGAPQHGPRSFVTSAQWTDLVIVVQPWAKWRS